MGNNDWLTDVEIDLLDGAKTANIHWFNAVVNAGEIMVERRQKYAGTHHPYFNFAFMARVTNRPIIDVFLFYLWIKLSRLVASGGEDFSDERVFDTLRDVGNYGFLAAGWILNNLSIEDIYPEAEHQAFVQKMSHDLGDEFDFDSLVAFYQEYGGNSDAG